MPVSPRNRNAVKPLLIGEANPYGGDPYFALYPSPEGCSGHRLCCLILKMRRVDYLREFEHVNLCWRDWNIREARDSARKILSDPKYTRIVLFGAKVSQAFGVPFKPFTVNGIGLVLPHPSGLSRSWNDSSAFARARMMMSEFLPGIAHLFGVTE